MSAAARRVADQAEETQTEIPRKPRPLMEGGWESISWKRCQLADLYGLPGETMPISNRKAARVYE